MTEITPLDSSSQNKENQILISDAYYKDVIGKGTYGIVYDVQLADGTNAALKRNLIDKESQHTHIVSVRELDILEKFSNHPLFVKIIKTIFSDDFNYSTDGESQDDSVHFVLERANYSLSTVIYDDVITYSFELVKSIIFQMLVSLEYFHGKMYFHRDIKPDNYLVFSNNNKFIVKMCDFGMSRPYVKYGPRSQRVTTAWYRAPEVMLGWETYSQKVDVWSLGMVIFELIARKAFFPDDMIDDNIQLWKYLTANHPEKLDKDVAAWMFGQQRFTNGNHVEPKHTSESECKSWITLMDVDSEYINSFSSTGDGGSFMELCDLLNKMLCIDPRKRYTAKQCLEHKYFKKMTQSLKIYRNANPPVPDPYHNVICAECIEYTWFYDMLRKFYHTENPLFTVERAMLATDIFNRIIVWKHHNRVPNSIAVETDTSGSLFTKAEVEKYFYVCFHLACKYYTSTSHLVSYLEINPEATDEEIKVAQHIEYQIITTICNKQLYRPTLYDVASRRDENFGTNMMWNMLWHHYFRPVSEEINLNEEFELRKTQATAHLATQGLSPSN